VRLVGGVGEFYDRLTGEKFVPRGSNYIRLADQQSPSGETFFYHSTFNAGLYESERADAALQSMSAAGYNTVRVFINGNCRTGCIGDPSGGLSTGYVANVVDFLHKAQNHGIYVILTTDGEPATPYYTRLLDSTWSEDFGGYNSNYLTGGGILVAEQFWGDLVEALLEKAAPMDAILAFALRNELFFETNAPPLSYTSGTVTPANGSTYDMASPEQRQRMMDENLVLWVDRVRAAILARDPTALVTVGFFPPDVPTFWSNAPRYIRTAPAVWDSSLDFVDYHPYPGGFRLGELVEFFGMSANESKPVLMGEFGASLSNYTTSALAARALHDWQVDSCKYGFDGWLSWTWDTIEQPEFHNELSGKEEIHQVLAAIHRPDPCEPRAFDFFEINLARGANVTASRSLPDQPPSGAVDGRRDRWWGAGAFAPQWIQIDLGKPFHVGLIRLVITQSPAGETVHQVRVGPTTDSLQVVHTFEGKTYDTQVLEFKPEAMLEDVRYILVVTQKSPSWVGWQEIEVLAP